MTAKAKAPAMPQDWYKLTVSVLRCTHEEIGRYGGLLINGRVVRPTRSLVIRVAKKYGARYKLRHSLVAHAFDQEKTRRGFSRFKHL